MSCVVCRGKKLIRWVDGELKFFDCTFCEPMAKKKREKQKEENNPETAITPTITGPLFEE